MRKEKLTDMPIDKRLLVEANEGNARALYYLGQAYLDRGLRGESGFYLEQAANKNDKEAQIVLDNLKKYL